MTRGRGEPALKSDRGAQAVEFALILVPLLILLAGLLQGGAALYSQITIQQAAREAVRAVALDLHTATSGTCDVAGCQAYATSIATSSASPVTVTSSNVSYSWNCTTSTSSTCSSGASGTGGCPSGADQNTIVTIKIANVTPLSLMPLLTFPSLNATASMPCGG